MLWGYSWAHFHEAIALGNLWLAIQTTKMCFLTANTSLLVLILDSRTKVDEK